MKTRTFSGTTNPDVQPYEIAHRAVARKAAADSIILLKNEGAVLPVPTDQPIALYGAGAGRTIKGGTGSGDVNERYSVTIQEGLEQAGYRITTKDWLEDYDRQFTAAREQWRDEIWEAADRGEGGALGLFDIYSKKQFAYPAGCLSVGKTEAEIAVYVLSRVAGEGADRYDREGDYYLSKEEKQLIANICAVYPQVVLVINTGGQVDLSFADEYKIPAILQISQLGCEGGNGFADVFSGKVAPAGKLTSTWAYRYEDYPNSATFSHNNGDVENEPYHEGIYVGYRYFDAFEVPVRYGFGFGLGYTRFSLRVLDLAGSGREEKKPVLSVKVFVKNVGTASGRETVQVYASCPQERMVKEYRRLVGFAKTKELKPGESEEVTVSFSAYDLASYCEKTPGWVLEQGVYGIFVGNSLEEAALSGTVRIDADQILVKTENICPLTEELEMLAAPEEKVQARRAAWLQAESTVSLPNVLLTAEDFSTETVVYGQDADRIPEDVKEFVDSLTVEQMAILATGDPGQGSLAALGSAGISVPGSAAQSNACLRERGLADIVFADGPAGLRLNKTYFVKDGQAVPEPFEKSLEGGYLCRSQEKPEGEEYFQYCTAFPVGTALAQTWDPELIAEVGKAAGEEMQMLLVTSWLAPGMNIHRNPLCGRNFEYYSEDPLLSGKIAAAMTNGVQSEKGCGTTIKHFACNNQEDNRMGSNSILSERVLREIYLKGFEIAIRESHPLMMMTSYNKVNGVHSANNYDLCTKAARDEWGFDGFIMTDWTTTHNGPDCTAAGCMRAGNDMVMPGRVEDQQNIIQELEAGTLELQELKSCICHLVSVIWKSNMYDTRVERS
ncbi:MAG: glycoside hydrolase family 3 C-terminal domain-containing protein [Lachnospiraceae bacterium]|nr:glycoside hydrolase family 3 C-terminal domain-containing protein [Lachnospiraceae bacterium]